jgi:hypothetical protein
LYSEIPKQVIFKLYLARVQIVSANAPEVTSMQVFECIGEEWKSPLQTSLIEVCLPWGVQAAKYVTAVLKICKRRHPQIRVGQAAIK